MKNAFETWENTQVFDWIPQADLPHILDGTNIAITRASATTLAELTTRPIHLIIIPLAISAGNHQYLNAQVYEKIGHTLIIESRLVQENLSQYMFMSTGKKIHTTKNVIAEF